MATRKKRRRKKKTVRKATTTKKRTSRSFEEPDRTKDPVYNLKPNDIVIYTPILGDGTEAPPETHIVCDTYYERAPDRINSWPTLRFMEGKFIIDNLHCWGPEACKIELLNKTHKLETTIVSGKVTYKLTKKRRPRAAKS